VNANARAFHAISSYGLKRSGCTVTLTGDTGVCACSLEEEAVITSRRATAKLRDRVQVVLERGEILVQKVEQDYIGGDVEIRTIRLQ
jgi:hypothetical protein